MAIKLQAQEQKVILNNIDKLVNSTKDTLLVECLYVLAIQLSPKNSEQIKKYTTLLNDLRSILTYEKIEPIAVTSHARFWASDGYYILKFNNTEFGQAAKLSHSELKAQFNFTFNKTGKYWQFKQSLLKFNVEHFIESMTMKINQDASRWIGPL